MSWFGRRRAWTLFVEPMESRRLLAASLLADINTTPSTAAAVSAIATIGNLAYFAENDGVHGNELWKTDGTTAGTSMVADINPGMGSSTPGGFVTIGSEIYFQANDGVHGAELWRTDGTAAGTSLVADIAPGNAASEPYYLVTTATHVFFYANDGVNGRELWSSDGTAAGTAMVKDVNPGSAGQSPLSPPAALPNGTVIFSASNGTGSGSSSDPTIWATDGTTIGTRALSTPSAVNTPRRLTVAGLATKYVYFTDTLGDLTRTDGVTLTTITTGPATFGSLTNVNGDLYYTNGLGLYYIPGFGAASPIHIVGAPGTTFTAPENVTAVGSNVYFTATDASKGTEVFVHTSSSNSASPLYDVVAGSAGSSPDNLESINGSLMWTATDASGDRVVWRGSATSTVAQVADLTASFGTKSVSASVAGAVGGSYLFVADSIANGSQLFRADQASAGILKVISPASASSGANGFFAAPFGVLFGADDAVHGRELWMTDGTTGGTTLLADIYPGAKPSSPGLFTLFAGRVYFLATDALHGRELWVTDGTAAGTTLVADINPGTADASPDDFIVTSNAMFFAATSAATGREVYRVDANGAVQLMADLAAGAPSSTPDLLGVVNNQLIVSAGTATDTYWNTLYSINVSGGAAPLVLTTQLHVDTAGIGFNDVLYFRGTSFNGGLSQLWRSDGTIAATYAIAARNGTWLTASGAFAPFNGRMYFAGTNASGSGLFSVDGSGLADEVYSSDGTLINSPAAFVTFKGRLYFTAKTSATRIDVWSTDGSSGGTSVAFGSWPIVSGVQTIGTSLYALNDHLFFYASDGVHGLEPWGSDGTQANTTQLGDLFPGSGSSVITSRMSILGARAFFAANVGLEMQLFVTDGTVAGTRLVADPNPGGFSGIQTPAIAYRDHIVFGGASSVYGTEPFVMPDTFAPLVLDAAAENETRQAFVLRFSEDVSASVTASDFVLRNRSSGQLLAASQLRLSFDPSSNTVTITPAASASWPDGDYELSLDRSAVSDLAGNTLASDAKIQMTILAGDVNHDRKVDFADLVILARNYNQTGKTFSQGNVDYSTDGKVDFRDLVILAQRYNTTLAAPDAPAALALTSSKKKTAAAPRLAELT